MGENNWGVFLSRGFHNPGLRGLSLSVQLERHPLPLATILCIVKQQNKQTKTVLCNVTFVNKKGSSCTKLSSNAT